MEWKDLGSFVKKFAPLLGTAIAGPAGTAAGGAVSLICDAFGVAGDDADDPTSVMRAIQGDPEAQIKLAQIQAENRLELSKIALQCDQAHLADRQNARLADVEKTKATGTRDWAMYLLAGIIVAGFFWLTWQMMSKPLPPESSDAVYLLFGGLNTSFAAVVGYFFGSSKGSSDKTNLLAQKP